MSYRQTSPTSMVRWSTVRTPSTPSPESSTDAPAEVELPAGENGYSVDSTTPEAEAGSDEEGAPWRRSGDRAASWIARPAASLAYKGGSGSRRLQRPLARAA